MGRKSAAKEAGDAPVKEKRSRGAEAGDDDQVEEAVREVTAAVARQSLSSLSFSERCAFASPIASPMAGKKLAKRLLKLVSKAHKHKNHLRSGLRDVQTRIRKGERGLVIFAGDVTPIDVMAHLPAVCEDKGIPYAYVPLRSDISDAMSVRRPTMMALVVQQPDSDAAFASYKELYDECVDAVRHLL